MRRDITEDTKRRLIPIYKKVEEDFSKFPDIKTTEDFFIWREQIKQEIEKKLKHTDKENDYEYKKTLRNEIVNDEIKGNESLELLNDWARFYRMIDRAKGNIRVLNYQYGIEDNDHVIKASYVLHNHLQKKGKGNTNDLADILQIEELNLLVKYPPLQRTINTPYEFERAIVKEDENEAWSAPLFITLLKAYGIEGDDLLEAGREFESLGNKYIEEIKNNYSSADDKSNGYTLKG